MSLTDEELERLAREEILRETKRGAERAKDHGAYGWQKPRIHPTNKNFLKNTLLSTLVGRRRDNANREPVRLPKEHSRPVGSHGKSTTFSDDLANKQSPDRKDERKIAADKSDRKRTHDGVRKKKQ
ncbi:protein POLR1D-like [Dermacentor albipictus]|uniref:protein POLR1D-like n=1 Tax=Dermacentor albipictus TaxID=60249 RepID=UPI0031FD7776